VLRSSGLCDMMRCNRYISQNANVQNFPQLLQVLIGEHKVALRVSPAELREALAERDGRVLAALGVDTIATDDADDDDDNKGSEVYKQSMLALPNGLRPLERKPAERPNFNALVDFLGAKPRQTNSPRIRASPRPRNRGLPLPGGQPLGRPHSLSDTGARAAASARARRGQTAASAAASQVEARGSPDGEAPVVPPREARGETGSGERTIRAQLRRPVADHQASPAEIKLEPVQEPVMPELDLTAHPAATHAAGTPPHLTTPAAVMKVVEATVEARVGKMHREMTLRMQQLQQQLHQLPATGASTLVAGVDEREEREEPQPQPMVSIESPAKQERLPAGVISGAHRRFLGVDATDDGELSPPRDTAESDSRSSSVRAADASPHRGGAAAMGAAMDDGGASSRSTASRVVPATPAAPPSTREGDRSQQPPPQPQQPARSPAWLQARARLQRATTISSATHSVFRGSPRRTPQAVAKH
jgi:hypothetical protein